MSFGIRTEFKCWLNHFLAVLTWESYFIFLRINRRITFNVILVILTCNRLSEIINFIFFDKKNSQTGKEVRKRALEAEMWTRLNWPQISNAGVTAGLPKSSGLVRESLNGVDSRETRR